MLMSLIMTFMFEPAKLQMNCANASGTSIALTEGVGALAVAASVIGINCTLRCPRRRDDSHDTTVATGPAGLESGPRSRSLRVTRPDRLDQTVGHGSRRDPVRRSARAVRAGEVGTARR